MVECFSLPGAMHFKNRKSFLETFYMYLPVGHRVTWIPKQNKCLFRCLMVSKMSQNYWETPYRAEVQVQMQYASSFQTVLETTCTQLICSLRTYTMLSRRSIWPICSVLYAWFKELHSLATIDFSWQKWMEVDWKHCVSCRSGWSCIQSIREEYFPFLGLSKPFVGLLPQL